MAKYYSLFGGTTTDTQIQVAKENQIIIDDGPYMFQSRCVIYKVEHNDNGYIYHFVTLDTKELRCTEISPNPSFIILLKAINNNSKSY